MEMKRKTMIVKKERKTIKVRERKEAKRQTGKGEEKEWRYMRKGRLEIKKKRKPNYKNI